MVKDIAEADYLLKNIYFPNLKRDSYYKTTSNKTDRYNCIAWAMRLTDRWVEPAAGTNRWWPKFHDGIYDYSPNGLIDAFKSVGFELCIDDSAEYNYDKVALYFERRSGIWTHAARVLSSKEYHSKAGEGWDFHHDNYKYRLQNIPEQKYSYGEVYAIMKRHKLKRTYSYFLMLVRLLQKAFIQPFVDIKNLINY